MGVGSELGNARLYGKRRVSKGDVERKSGDKGMGL